MHRRVDNLFATPIGISNLDHSVCSTAKQEVQKLLDKESLSKSLSGSTKDNLNTLSQFKELVKHIDNEVQSFSTEALGLEQNSLSLSCMWSNSQIGNTGNGHRTHQHPNSFLSGVVYLNVPADKDIGDISFIDPRPAKMMQHGNFIKESPISYRAWKYKPEFALMLLFPSWLEHCTDRFTTDTDECRISLSFNYALTKCSINTMRIV